MTHFSRKFHPTSIYRLAVLAILPAALSLQAQPVIDMTGSWQGVVKYPLDSPDRKTVLKVLASDTDGFRGNFYSIEQNAAAFPFTGTVKGTTLKLNIPGIGAVYEGKLSADGNTLTGTIKQGFPMPIQWNLKRVPEEEAWPLMKPATPPKPMQAGIDPNVEVATIKLTPPVLGRISPSPGASFQAYGATLRDLIKAAYDVHPNLIMGAPAWYSTERYDILVKADHDGQPNDEQLKSLLRKLLKDRFQLAIHREQQELPVYALTVGKGGAKISKTQSTNEAPLVINRAAGRLSFNFESMADFAMHLQTRVVDRPVVNKTGLAGRYDFTLDFTPDNVQVTRPTGGELTPGDRIDSPNVFGAVQQQLGLKLDAVKMKVEVLVVDKAEKASDN